MPYKKEAQELFVKHFKWDKKERAYRFYLDKQPTDELVRLSHGGVQFENTSSIYGGFGLVSPAILYIIHDLLTVDEKISLEIMFSEPSH